MIARVIEWMLRRKLHPTSFPDQIGDTARATTEEVLASFTAGARASLQRLGRQAVMALESEVAWHRRCFFWEGYAFGLAGRHALGFRPGSPDRSRIISHYRAMHYTGYGFWNGVAGAYHLPAVSERRQRWAGVSDFDRFSPLVAGGAGFAVTGLAAAWRPDVVRRLERCGPSLWVDAALHGCGRALWFLYMHNVGRLESALDEQPRYAELLCEGLGVAIAFTHVAAPDLVERTVNAFAARRRAGLLRGVGVCLHELTNEDPAIAPSILAIEVPAVRAALERSASAAKAAGDGPGWYWRYVAMLRSKDAQAAGSACAGHAAPSVSARVA
jgi:hypothetical protein